MTKKIGITPMKKMRKPSQIEETQDIPNAALFQTGNDAAVFARQTWGALTIFPELRKKT